MKVVNLYIFPKANTTVAFYGENIAVVIGEDCQATFPGNSVTEEGNKEAQGDIMTLWGEYVAQKALNG